MFDKKEREKHIASFVKVKKKLAELIPWDAKQDAARRWIGLDGLVHKIENAAYSDKCYDVKTNRCILDGIATVEDDDFRIRLVKQIDLKAQLDTEQKTAKWGQYLRAPQVYFDLISEHKDKFVPLREVADIKFGIKTGVNEIFYLTEETIKHWGIEEEFLAPVIKSPKDSASILIDTSKLELKVFLCNKSKEELRKEKKFGALKYIQWGEKQTTSDGILFPEITTVAARNRWYFLGERSPGSILLFMNSGDIHRVLYNTSLVFVDHNLFELFVPNEYKFGLLLYLNSSMGALFKEMIGRANLGEGGLKVEGVDWQSLLCPSHGVLQVIADKNTEGFKHFLSRPIKPIFEEVKMKDRRELDSLILAAMGLDPQKYLQPIYDGLTELVRERIELAAMRKKLSKTKKAQAPDKMKEQIIAELVQSGIKQFPDDFLVNKLKPQDYIGVPVPNVPLRLGHYFLGQQDVVGEGFNYTARSLAAAKYIIYAHKPDEYIVYLPNDDIVVTKAVAEYEQYLKELLKKLNQEILNRTFDHKLAESISKRIFEELGLPLVSG